MDNPIYYNKEDMEFIEKNYDELSESIGPEKYNSKYYIGSFRYPERDFNTGAFYYQSLWFGYRKMYRTSFIVGFLGMMTLLLPMFLGAMIASKGNIPAMFVRIGNAKEDSTDLYYMSAMILIIVVSVIASYVFIFLVGKYANSIYFRSLKKRVISKNKKKYGKSKIGILYGFLLGTLGIFFALVVISTMVWGIIALNR